MVVFCFKVRQAKVYAGVCNNRLEQGVEVRWVDCRVAGEELRPGPGPLRPHLQLRPGLAG